MATDRQQHDHEKTFFASGRDVETLLDVTHDLCEAGVRIYGVVLSTSTALAGRIGRLSEERGKLRGFAIAGESPYLIELPRYTGDGHRDVPAKAFMWQDSSSELCYFLTCQPRECFDYLFDLVHSFLQPDICRLFLRTPQIEESLTSVARAYPKMHIRVRQYVARKWVETRTHRGRIDTTVQYTNEDYAAVFRELEVKGMWLSSLGVETTGSEACAGRISRDNSFSCTGGFGFFFERFVDTFARRMLDFRQLFQNRGRISSPTKASKPLKILYKAGLFADKKNNYRLINVLESCPHSALSVFHPNPYLHASLIDYSDGSSYSILVTTSTGILITPERKATPQSLARLCDYICNNFEEGDVVEFTPHEH